jgi:quinol monooxygenase YgiN
MILPALFRQASPACSILTVLPPAAGDLNGRYSRKLERALGTGEYPMIILRVILNVAPEKHKELKQTLTCMIADIRRETACSQVNAHLDIEDENRLFVLSHWESRDRLNDYLRSEKFSALLGTKILLRSNLLAFIDTVAMREGIEAIMAVRFGG